MELAQLTFRDPGYTLNDFINIPDSVLQFKKHFTHLAEAKDLPSSVYNVYFPKNKPLFQYLLVKGILSYPIPVSRVAITKLLKEDKPDKFTYIPHYQQGFLQGLETCFVPFVDTTEHRQELIFKEIHRNISAFPSRLLLKHKDFSSMENAYAPEDFYDYGITVGKVYKAWSHLLENPHYYAAALLEIGKSTTSAARKHVYRPSQKEKQLHQKNLFEKLGNKENINSAGNPNYNPETKHQKNFLPRCRKKMY